MRSRAEAHDITTQGFLLQRFMEKSLRFSFFELRWNAAERHETYCNGPQRVARNARINRQYSLFLRRRDLHGTLCLSYDVLAMEN